MPRRGNLDSSRERENLLLQTIGVIMATEVVQTYTSSQNVSITIREGNIDLVSVWVTGLPATETNRYGSKMSKF